MKLVDNRLTQSLWRILRQVRVETTDAEFYSLTRQLNRLTHGAGGIGLDPRRVEVTVVASDPVVSLADRVAAAVTAVRSGTGCGGCVDMVYVSQVTGGNEGPCV